MFFFVTSDCSDPVASLEKFLSALANTPSDHSSVVGSMLPNNSPRKKKAI